MNYVIAIILWTLLMTYDWWNKKRLEKKLEELFINEFRVENKELREELRNQIKTTGNGLYNYKVDTEHQAKLINRQAKEIIELERRLNEFR